MKICSLQLENFRQYKGQQPPILFSTDDTHNVTVILGVNTSGKTTLIQAFRWCLYGNTNFKTQKVLNEEVELDMVTYDSRKVSAIIVLVHEGREYTISRTQIFRMSELGRLRSEESSLKIQYKEDNGEQQSISSLDTAKIINKILPDALSDYFFFDGERIADINNRSDVVASVRGLMGLDVLGEARDHLDPVSVRSVTSKLTKELVLGSDQQSEELKKKHTHAQERREDLRTRRVEAQTEVAFFDQRKEDLSQKLLSCEEVKKIQLQRQKVERDIKYTEESIQQTESSIKSVFQRHALQFFAYPLLKRAMETIDSSHQDGIGIPEMRQAAIDHILARNRCICGCDLVENQGARKRILFEKGLLPPAHIGTILRTQRETYERFHNETSGYADAVADSFAAYRRNVLQLDEKQSEYSDLCKAIAESNNIDVAMIERDYDDAVRNLAAKRELFDRLGQEIGAVENTISEAEKNIDRLTVTSEKNNMLKRYISYSKALFAYFNKEYSKRENEVKERLLESVNRIFAQMYHGHRTVSINDKYQIVLSTQFSNTMRQTDESKGLEVVKNFSFIAGLVDLARQEAKSLSSSTDSDIDGELQISTEPYPLVMDAPFSNADEIHIRNISTIIPGIAEQVILIVMKKDWEFAKDALAGKVNKIYQIEKVNNSETNSVIRGGCDNV